VRERKRHAQGKELERPYKERRSDDTVSETRMRRLRRSEKGLREDNDRVGGRPSGI
jgi:hypothetical protein